MVESSPDRNTRASRRGAAKPHSLNNAIFALSVLVIARCLWRVFTRGGEWPLPPLHYYAMATDTLLLGSMLALARWPVGCGQSNPDRKPLVRLLLLCGIGAGIVLLMLRFTSDAAWWTGHLYNMWG